MSIFFTSDHHWGHRNIIRYSNRPFNSVNEMDEVLIQNWNSVVQKGDVVYHLGDIFLCEPGYAIDIRNRLNGQIYLIRGNHERTAEQVYRSFVWIKDYFKLKVNDNDHPYGRQEIAMFHYPIASWDKHHHGCWHLHGHCHSNHNPWKSEHMPNARSFDIGVDSVAEYLAGSGSRKPEDYRPLSYDEVKTFMKAKQGSLSVDHHEDHDNE